MAFYAIECLNGLSHASALFLMAAGLTLIFGVTRIVNFAHGSFFMLGALFSAHWVTDWFAAWGDSALLYSLAIVFGAVCAGLIGAMAELLLLRHLYLVPGLYQLVATFGLSLALHDAMRWVFGPGEVFAPRFPGLGGAVPIGEAFFPQYQLLTMALGPLVWLGLHLLLQHTRFGQRLRAAAQDREMLAALGVGAGALSLGVVALGCFLAGLGGALQVPREPAHLQMDVNVVVETFVVVVTGGLGSVGGAFFAALLIGMVHTLGVALFPQATLVLVFLVMALVLALRPRGLGGQALQDGPLEMAQKFHIAPAKRAAAAIVYIAFGVALAILWWLGGYWQALAIDALILGLLGVSLQAMMALGGLVSFGHAAFFALGGYGAALAHLRWGLPLSWALVCGCVLATLVAALAGVLLVRASGVYLAMLSLALAQVLWAMVTQWEGLTGGDNGLIGLQLLSEDRRSAFYVLLCALALGCVWALARLSRSSLGAALQAVRDAPQRAQASGLALRTIPYRVYVGAAGLAALAGGLRAAHQGAVFPSQASVTTSLDALLVVLLGGMHQLWGVWLGSSVLVGASAGLGRGFDYWRGVLGVLVMGIMVLAPSGLLGRLQAGRRP